MKKFVLRTLLASSLASGVFLATKAKTKGCNCSKCTCNPCNCK